MLKLNIIISVLVCIILCLTGLFIYNRWINFKDLKPGDTCCRYIEYDSLTEEFVMDEIIAIDVDERGYTTKIYIKDGSFSFWDFIIHGMTSIYAD